MTVLLHIRALEPTTRTEKIAHEVMDRWQDRLPDKDYPHTYAMGAQPNKSEFTTLDEGNALVGAVWGAGIVLVVAVALVGCYLILEPIRHFL